MIFGEVVCTVAGGTVTREAAVGAEINGDVIDEMMANDR